MAKTIIGSGGNRIDGTSGASFFLPIGMNFNPVDISRTEAEVSHTVTKAGVISNLRVNVQLNNATSAGTVYIRKNGADSALSVTITASTTGWFTTTGSLSVAPGDTIAVRVANGNNSTFYRSFVADFEAADGTSTQWLSAFVDTTATNSNTTASARHKTIFGRMNATESVGDTQYAMYMPQSGTIAGFQLYVGDNTLNAAQSYVVTGASGGTITINVPAGTTGLFTSASTVTFSAGDTITVAHTSSQTSGSYNLRRISMEVEWSTGFVVAAQATTPPSALGTSYDSILGDVFTSTTESQIGLRHLAYAKAVALHVYSTSTGPGADNTFTNRKGGVDQTGTLTVTSGSTGWAHSSSFADTFVSGDTQSLKAVLASGSTTNVRSIIVDFATDSSSRTIVQSARAHPNNTSATFAVAPTQGNLLVAIAPHWANGATVASGWTLVQNTNGVNSDGIAVAYKYAGAAESTAQSAFTDQGVNAGWHQTIWEISGVVGNWAADHLRTVIGVDQGPSNPLTPTALTVTAADSMILGTIGSVNTSGSATTLTVSPGTVDQTVDGQFTGDSRYQSHDWFHKTFEQGDSVSFTGTWSTTPLKQQYAYVELAWPAAATPTVTATPGAGSLAFSGKGVTFLTTVIGTPGAGSLTFTGYAPAATTTFVATAGKGELAFTGYTITPGFFAGVGLDTLTFTGYAPAGVIPSIPRVSQFGAMTVVSTEAAVRASQFGAHALAETETTLRTSQYGLNVLAETTTRTRISQMGLLVLAKGGTPPPTPDPLRLVPSGRSKVVNLRFVNMYYEPTPDGPAPNARFGRPGLVQASQRGAGPVRAIFEWQGFQFTVSGDSVWRDNENIGFVNAGDDVRWATSETEIVLVTNGAAYYVTLNDVTPFSDFDVPDPVIDVLFSGGRFLYLSGVNGQARVYYSEVGDAQNVDALSFFTAESRPDNLMGGIVLGNDIALFGTNSVDWYYATGNNDAPFDGQLGRAYTKGLAARQTLQLIDNTGFFLGSDRIVYKMAQAPIRVSTFDIEDKIRRVADEDLADAWAFPITIGGHAYYVISLPGQGTHALDISQNLWYEWKSWGKPNFRARSAFGFFMGDEYTGTIMSFDAQTFTDLGEPLERVTSTYLRHQGKPEKNFKLYLAALRAVGTAVDCVNPVVEMRYSDDEGHTFTPWMEAPLGQMGKADESAKAIWDQLGVVQSPGRLYEFRVTDPVEFAPYQIRYNELY